jgi:hypothetical protein
MTREEDLVRFGGERVRLELGVRHENDDERRITLDGVNAGEGPLELVVVRAEDENDVRSDGFRRARFIVRLLPDDADPIWQQALELSPGLGVRRDQQDSREREQEPGRLFIRPDLRARRSWGRRAAGGPHDRRR